MGKRILVVDDEPDITRMIKRVLELTGRYEVGTENLGRSADRLYRASRITFPVKTAARLRRDRSKAAREKESVVSRTVSKQEFPDLIIT